MQWVSIGRVTAPHGLRGEVRVVPLTDVDGRFEQVGTVYVHLQDGVAPRQPMHVVRVSYRKSLVILGLQEVTNVDQANALRNALLQVPISEVAPLPDGSFYVFQLIGMRVETVSGEHIGVVADVISGTGANDCYVVKRSYGEQALIPAVHQFIKQVDLEGGRMIIDPIPGLL